jgi:hypothetical protein
MDPFDWSIPQRTTLIRPPEDEEAARYRMLAYLQRVTARYKEHKLYPYIDELASRIRAIRSLLDSRERFDAELPLPITGLDVQRGRILRSAPEGSEMLRALDALAEHTLPELKRMWSLGEELRERLVSKLYFEPVGIRPLRTNEGYLLLCEGRIARVYSFSLRPISLGEPADPQRELITRYVTDYSLSIAWTFEQVRTDLLARDEQLPNPAVYAFSTELCLPAIETFVPLAKQLLWEEVTRTAA